MMMKRLLLLTIMLISISVSTKAQQRIPRGEMSYLMATKQNSIIYRDTLYSGSQQFKYLFYRTRDETLIRFYEKHQSNKLIGSALGAAGAIAIFTGVSKLSNSSSSKGEAWAWLGGGVAGLLSGGYLIFMGQQNLQAAVTLFNQRYGHTSLNLGMGDKQAGLVLKF
jgi:hypothetical protein